MSTANSLNPVMSDPSKRLPLRARPDLVCEMQRFQGRTAWVVKDPLGLKYFRFAPQEFAVLQLLDGRRNLSAILSEYHKLFPEHPLSQEELAFAISTLHHSDLLISDAAGHGAYLSQRRVARRRKAWQSRLSNVLAIRFRGIDPEPILKRIAPSVEWMFRPTAVAGCGILAISALLLVIVHFRQFQTRMPDTFEFFGFESMVWVAAALMIAKVCHELAHGLACRHFGGESHEMGVMLLVFTPCLYVNVSDSWLLPRKWQRVVVMAAGMYIEIVIASFCTFLWWYTHPGMLNTLCLRLMLVCSVTTVLFNANPLMRYDGYYIVSDLLEIPNLRQRSSQAMRRLTMRWFLGMQPQQDRFLAEGRQTLFLLYSVAASVYRWMLAGTIVWIMIHLLKPYGLELIGYLFALASLYGLLVRPLLSLYEFLKAGINRRVLGARRVRLLVAGAGAIFLAMAFLPLPCRVAAKARVMAGHAMVPVYVTVPGTLEVTHASVGNRVHAGQKLAELSNHDVQLKLTTLSSGRAQQAAQLARLRVRQFDDANSREEIPAVEASLSALSQQAEAANQLCRRLTLVAPVDGVIASPPEQTPDFAEDGVLPQWSGSPLDPENLGCRLEAGTPYCLIRTGSTAEIELEIDQSDLEGVDIGSEVEIVLDQHTHTILQGRICELDIAETVAEPLRVRSTAESSLSGHEASTRKSQDQLGMHYRARVAVDDPDGWLLPGQHGQAKISARWQPLLHRAWNALLRTFRFSL